MMLALVFIAVAMGISACSSPSEPVNVSPLMSQYLEEIAPIATDPQFGRDFRQLSIHPNGTDLLFVECSLELDPAGGCYVLGYNRTTQELRRYAFPDGYFYEAAYFSPQGRYIVMSRRPKTDPSEGKFREAYESSEIVMMRTDGTDFKVLPLTRGRKIAPVMSKDETKIAYWRASLRPPGSKTVSSKFDIWEFNLKNGQDTLFAGPFQFFTVSGLQYLSQDEMLVGAYGPRQYAQSYSEYSKKYNNSEVYRIRRSAVEIPEPMLTEVQYAAHPSLDVEGNVYFSGDRPGSSFFRKSTLGVIDQYQFPPFPKGIGAGSHISLVAAPDGSYMAFIFEYAASPWNYRKQSGKHVMGIVNTRTSEWSYLRIPPLQSSTMIDVKVAN